MYVYVCVYEYAYVHVCNTSPGFWDSLYCGQMLMQAGLVNGTASAIFGAIKEEGVAGLYSGIGSNIAYAFPADAMKFLVRCYHYYNYYY